MSVFRLKKKADNGILKIAEILFIVVSNGYHKWFFNIFMSDKNQNNIADELLKEIRKEKGGQNISAFEMRDKSIKSGQKEIMPMEAIDINELLPPAENSGQVKKTAVAIAVILFFMIAAGGFMIYRAMKNTDRDSQPEPAASEVEVIDENNEDNNAEENQETGNESDSELISDGEGDKEPSFDWLIRREYAYGFSYQYPDKWEVLQDERLTGVEQNTLFRDIETGERLPIRIQVVPLSLEEFIKISLRQQYEWVKDVEIDGKDIKQMYYKSPHDGQSYDVYLLSLGPGYSLRVMGQETEELLDPILYSFKF